MRPSKIIIFISFLIVVPALLLMANPKKSISEKSSAAFDEIDENLTLFFKDALTGKGIPGGVFTIDGKTGKTDSSGKVTIRFSGFSQMEKDYKGVFKKQGYITSEITVKLKAGGVFNHHHSISPILNGKLRIIVDWGSKPKDLDAHLLKKDSYHISYRNMKKYEDHVVLDRDERNGHGPETITIMKLDEAGHYNYYVHDYSNRDNKRSSALGRSGATVKVYNNRELIYEFFVGQGNGTVWKVFSIQNGVFVPLGQID